jgi:nitrite reductase/ring-hydroxylating ferredoxin subunit
MTVRKSAVALQFQIKPVHYLILPNPGPLLPNPRLSMSDFVTVARVGSIPEGTGAAFPVGDRLVAVFNLGSGQYHAIDDVCPHMGMSLASGGLDGDVVTCPWHAWRFRVTDGTWCDNPRIKTAVFEVRVVGEEIQVRPSDSK